LPCKGEKMRILVTGATGKVGTELVRFLRAGGSEVVAVARNPDAVDFPEGVQEVKADLSLASAAASGITKGVDAIYLNLAAMENAAKELVSKAADDGVRLAVVQSAITVEYGGGYLRFAERFRAVEEIVKASGMRWTFLRCSDFASNSRVWIPQIRAGDVVRGAYGAASTTPINERDIAAMAAEVLTHEDHAGKSYSITGPQSLSQFERVRIIGEGIGRRLRFEDDPPELVRAAMISQGVPPEVLDRMLGYLATCLSEPGPTTNTIARVLGRPPLPFAQWVDEHRREFGAR
jgi:uncharacterized protein YbjT (DUF2867 family)